MVLATELLRVIEGSETHVHAVLDQLVVEILAAEMGVAVRRHHLEETALDCQERHIEGSAAKIEDEHVATTLLAQLVEAVGDGRGGRLVDDAQDVQAGDQTGILGRLALTVVEVRGNGDDRIRHLLAKVRLGDLLHFAENHGRDLLYG